MSPDVLPAPVGPGSIPRVLASCVYVACLGFVGSSGYPTLRIEKNDLRSVTLLEAKAKVKDIAMSRERVTLRDVLQEGTCYLNMSC